MFLGWISWSGWVPLARLADKTLVPGTEDEIWELLFLGFSSLKAAEVCLEGDCVLLRYSAAEAVLVSCRLTPPFAPVGYSEPTLYYGYWKD